MKRIRITGPIVLTVLLAGGSAFAQRATPLADNAALRYWAAFSVLQDAAITDEQAKELNAALDTLGPLEISKYTELVHKNSLALNVMARGTSLPNCDWGLDYALAEDIPGEYVRKALVLGRLNILYAMQQYHAGDKDGAVRTLTAGLRFSRDVSNGGSLFATLVAKNLLVTHLMAVSAGLRMGQLSASQQSQLQNAVTALGDGPDWAVSARRDLEALRPHYANDQQSAVALNRIISSYTAYLNDPSKLPALTDALNTAPPALANLIPNPKRVLEQKQELADKLQQTRGLLR